MSNFTLDHSHELGAGGYGKVVLAKDNTTGEKVAAKMISMSRMKMSAIERENDLSAQRARAQDPLIFSRSRQSVRAVQ